MKKFLMLFLIILFLSILIFVYVYRDKLIKREDLSSVSEMQFSFTPTPAVDISPTLSPVHQELQVLKNNLKKIENDINKLTNEDKRLIPPEFIFDLGID